MHTLRAATGSVWSKLIILHPIFLEGCKTISLQWPSTQRDVLLRERVTWQSLSGLERYLLRSPSLHLCGQHCISCAFKVICSMEGVYLYLAHFCAIRPTGPHPHTATVSSNFTSPSSQACHPVHTISLKNSTWMWKNIEWKRMVKHQWICGGLCEKATCSSWRLSGTRRQFTSAKGTRAYSACGYHKKSCSCTEHKGLVH